VKKEEYFDPKLHAISIKLKGQKAYSSIYSNIEERDATFREIERALVG
jgi:hypothetical protein